MVKLGTFCFVFGDFGMVCGVLLGLEFGVGFGWRWRMCLLRDAGVVYSGGGGSGVGK